MLILQKYILLSHTYEQSKINGEKNMYTCVVITPNSFHVKSLHSYPNLTKEQVANVAPVPPYSLIALYKSLFQA